MYTTRSIATILICASPDRRVKNHAERREQKELVDFEHRDEQHRAERAQEADSRFAMQIVRDAALREAGVDQRQHVHARANRQDVAIVHPRIEAPHDPGQARRIDRAVEQRVRHEHRQEIEYRHLRQRLLDFANRDAPEDQREDRDGAEIRNRLAPERCCASRRDVVARRIARAGNRAGAHASRHPDRGAARQHLFAALILDVNLQLGPIRIGSTETIFACEVKRVAEEHRPGERHFDTSAAHEAHAEVGRRGIARLSR